MLKLRFIKAVVFLMTFLLIFGTLFLGNHFIRKLRTSSIVEPTKQISLEEPTESQIVQISSEKQNLYILVRGGGRPDRIIIFDPQTQRKVSNINIY